MTIPDDRRHDQIDGKIANAAGSAEAARLLFAELRSTLGLAKASQLWWAYFGRYDAAET